VLDVGSPKLLSVFLAARLGSDVHATDLVDDFVESSELHGRVALGENRGRYVARCADARRLPYPAETFDRVFSISTIEHIPADGDTVAMREIARVLVPGGLAAFTVPWRDGGYLEEFKDPGDPDVYWVKDDDERAVFYQRAYDRQAFEVRLLCPSGLSLVDLSFWGERRSRVERVILHPRLPRWMRRSLYPAHFLLARAFLRPLAEDEPSRKKVACFTLGKEPA
jgi:SAM-dependent methyltransferase